MSAADDGVAKGKCLHLVMSSGESALEDCMACSQAGDTILLMNTAVTWLIRPSALHQVGEAVEVCCLDADVRAHGLGAVVNAGSMNCVNDRGLVDLVCRHQHCLSWK